MRKEFFEGMRKVRHATNLRQCLVIFVVKISYVLLSAAALCLCVLSTAPSFSIDGEKEKVLFYRHLASPRFVRFRRVGRDVSSDSLDYLDPAPGSTILVRATHAEKYRSSTSSLSFIFLVGVSSGKRPPAAVEKHLRVPYTTSP